MNVGRSSEAGEHTSGNEDGPELTPVEGSVTFISTHYFAPADTANDVVTALARAAYDSEKQLDRPLRTETADGCTFDVRAGWPSAQLTYNREHVGKFVQINSTARASLELTGTEVVALSPDLRPPAGSSRDGQTFTGVGEVEVVLTGFGFAVTSITLRPPGTLALDDLLQWIAQFAGIEQAWTEQSGRATTWQFGHSTETTTGWARDALQSAFEKITGPAGRRALQTVTPECGAWSPRRQRQFSVQNQSGAARDPHKPATLDEVFANRYTHGVHVSIYVEDAPADRRSLILERLRERLALTHGGSRQLETIEPQNVDETWLLGEFATVALSSDASERSAVSSAGPEGSDRWLEDVCRLRLSKALALRKGLLNAVNRATVASITSDQPIHLKKQLAYWRWLTNVAGQDLMLPWDAGRLEELLATTESGANLKGVRSLEQKVERNLASFEQQTDRAVERSLSIFAAFFGVATLLGLAMDAFYAEGDYRWYVAVLALLAVVVVTVVVRSWRRHTLNHRTG